MPIISPLPSRRGRRERGAFSSSPRLPPRPIRFFLLATQRPPGTRAAQLGVRDAYIPGDNIRGGVLRYLAEELLKSRGDRNKAAACYNFGSRSLPIHPSRCANETQCYASRLLPNALRRNRNQGGWRQVVPRYVRDVDRHICNRYKQSRTRTTPSADADIARVWTEYDVFERVVMGMRIHIRFTVRDLSGQEIFRHQEDEALKD